MFPSMSSDGSMNAAQPLPPLPDLSTKPGGNNAQTPDDPFEATMKTIKPVSDGVNDIHMAIAKIARTGIIPIGGVLDQLSALVSSLVPMAAQSMLMPGGSGALPPPSGAPPDLGAGAGPVSPGPPPGPGV